MRNYLLGWGSFSPIVFNKHRGQPILSKGCTMTWSLVLASVCALRWHGRHSAEVNENINLGYSHDQGYS